MLLWGFWLPATGLAISSSSQHIFCLTEQESNLQSFRFEATDTPYFPQIIKIKDFFLVKGLYFVSPNQKANYVKISTYYLTDQKEPVLIHQMRFDEAELVDTKKSLGEHLIYSPLYGRELRLQCHWVINEKTL